MKWLQRREEEVSAVLGHVHKSTFMEVNAVFSGGRNMGAQLHLKSSGVNFSLPFLSKDLIRKGTTLSIPSVLMPAS